MLPKCPCHPIHCGLSDPDVSNFHVIESETGPGSDEDTLVIVVSLVVPFPFESWVLPPGEKFEYILFVSDVIVIAPSLWPKVNVGDVLSIFIIVDVVLQLPALSHIL